MLTKLVTYKQGGQSETKEFKTHEAAINHIRENNLQNYGLASNGEWFVFVGGRLLIGETRNLQNQNMLLIHA